MKAIKAKTKSGKDVFKAECSGDEVQDGTLGFCIACGEEVNGVEPDARKYECECCGQPKVYGLEELLMMGYVVLK